MKIGILSILILPFLSTAVIAEESPRGRLADGRAYRTDESGNQLVDYIAELEVNTEAMNRRIVGLEDELAEKQRIIERLNRGGTGAAAFQGELKEKTLTADANPAANHGVKISLERANAETTRLENELREQTARRVQEKNADRIEIGRLQTELETERRLRDQDQATYAAVSRECAALRVAPKSTCDGAVAQAVQATVRERSVREGELQAQIAAARLSGATELTQAQTRNEELEALLAKLKGELTAARASLAGAEADLAGARSALAVATRPVARVAPVVEPVQVSSVVAPIRPVARDYASRSRLAVVDSLRGSMLSDLKQVRSLVVTRDNLFGRSTGQGDRRVTFKPSPLLSTSRRTLDDIATEIRAAEQVHELTRLRADIAEIRALVQADIDLLRRTGRVG